jgi:two-component system chemotaxis response regulator CheY
VRALHAVASGARPEVVVTDLDMPEFDGGELTRRLHASTSSRETPVLIYSGAPVERLKSAAQAAGASAWLQKPAGAEALTAMIACLLDVPRCHDVDARRGIADLAPTGPRR